MSSYNLPEGAPRDDRFKTFLEGIKLWQIYSQSNEDSIIAAIFERIGTTNKWAFECGCADGLFFSTTQLLIDQGWQALLVEWDESDFEKCKKLHYDNPNVTVYRGFLSAWPQHSDEITLDNVLTNHGAPESLDLLVLDVDSSEYFLLNSLVAHHPRVVVVEFDPDAEPMFIPQLRGPGQAGHLAMRYVCEARGYDVVCRTKTNLICVRKDLSGMLMGGADGNDVTNSGVSNLTALGQLQAKANRVVCPHGKPLTPTPLANGRYLACPCCGDTKSPVIGSYCEDCRNLAQAEQQRQLAMGQCPHGVTLNPTGVYAHSDGVKFCVCCKNFIGTSETYSLPSLCANCAPSESDQIDNTRFQVFAANRWQDFYDGANIEVLPEEQDAANAGKLPTRKLESEKRKVRIAAVMSLPRLGYLDAYDSIVSALQGAGVSRALGWGVFFHHSMSRGITTVLGQKDADGEPFDFIITADYDSFVASDDLIALAKLLAQHPEADAIVPVQVKRGGSLEVLAETMTDGNLTKELVPIRTGHFGFTIFRREFFERLPKPWFRESPDANGDWGEGRTDSDIGLWQNAEAAGLKMFLATKIVIGHGDESVVYPRIKDGKIEKVFQAVQDWQATKTRPEGIGVIQ